MAIAMYRVYRPIANEFAPTEFRGAAKSAPGVGSTVGANLFAKNRDGDSDVSAVPARRE